MDKGIMVRNLILNEMEKKKLNPNRIAHMSGVGRRGINYWSEGKTIPTITAADKVLKALGMSVTIGKEADDE